MPLDAIKTVLYVEDNAVNIYLVQAIFAERTNLRLLTATSGKQGLELAWQERPDLILLDLNLPDMGGEAFLTTLRTIPAVAAIPVVIVSADAMEDQRTHFLGLNVADYVTKPFDIDQFERVVNRHLHGERPA